jgi:hypothetical protein
MSSLCSWHSALLYKDKGFRESILYYCSKAPRIALNPKKRHTGLAGFCTKPMLHTCLEISIVWSNQRQNELHQPPTNLCAVLSYCIIPTLKLCQCVVLPSAYLLIWGQCVSISNNRRKVKVNERYLSLLSATWPTQMELQIAPFFPSHPYGWSDWLCSPACTVLALGSCPAFLAASLVFLFLSLNCLH